MYPLSTGEWRVGIETASIQYTASDIFIGFIYMALELGAFSINFILETKELSSQKVLLIFYYVYKNVNVSQKR